MSGYELGVIVDEDGDSNNRKGQNSELPEVIIRGLDNRLSGLPTDKYMLVFLILFIHGIGSLMPWNMFINARDYFLDYKLARVGLNSTNLPSEDGIDNMRGNFMSYLGFASQLPNIIFNGLNLLVNFGSGNMKLRVNLTLAMEALIFIFTIILAVVDSSQWQRAFFYLTMLSVVLLNMASGIYQNCIFGTGAKFPSSYTNAILIGSNFSGTFTSIVNLISIWLAPKPQEAAIYYFITALFVIVICLISYNLLPYNMFYRHFDGCDRVEETDQLELDVGQNCIRSISESDDIPDTLRQTVDAMVPRPQTSHDKTFRGELERKWLVLKKCWPQCLNVFLTFYVTLALFPAVLSEIKQVQGLMSDKYYTSFACFLLFNVFAMVGNLISGWTTWPGKDRLWIMVLARFIFVPFFLLCKFQNNRTWPVLVTNDIVFMIANVLFALSSGYLSSLCMMFASVDLKAEDAAKAGMLAAFFLVFGIFMGVNSSFLLTWIVQLG